MGWWWSIAKAFFRKLSKDKVSILAAAVAFYALLSVFPAFSALVSLYGLIADPSVVRTQLSDLQGVIPDEALSLLSQWLDSLLKSQQSGFGLGLLIGLTISLWIARNATGTMMTALNVAFDDVEERGIVRYHVVAFLLTALLILLGIASIVLVAGVPALIGLVPLPSAVESTISLVRWPILAVIIVTAIALTYRFGPTRRDPRWGWTSAGALFATFLWIAGSIGLSLYVENFANYDKTYGSIGAVVVLLLWFWLGAYAVLAGAELNSVIRSKLDEAESRNGADEYRIHEQ